VAHTSANPDRPFSPGRTTGGDSLPVELSSFEGRAIGEETVRLAWQTASEQNNAGFDVQYQSPSSESWQILSFVESKATSGTTTQIQSYRYVTVGPHRFRLRQVDLDGSGILTDPVTVELQMQKALRLGAPSPNPVSDTATLSFAVKKETRATVAVYNVLGQWVKTPYEGTPTGGEGQHLRLDAGNATRTRRLTVVR